MCLCLCYNRLIEVLWIPPGDAVLSDTGSHGQHMHATLTAVMFEGIYSELKLGSVLKRPFIQIGECI